ncbi:Tm-1-like ATP-binding domain-containing protein [Novosphingobium cyanobacteriorum]|uniref:Tm-1-like ATP-binding domain-containing protein n=1 Tax=Novosphingobium cyanobacteriorum TaxID=3024215 RepID=A0ABT6CHK1_9SPHN|nr:Tm-1-like ATP-binding domain-containing protein [Novosphingobium cyanobacteriorum]MDF8331817.1 Tm-1-like ATP-binding domain-containing protein [Novosphingobium cyanobacteriorum]
MTQQPSVMLIITQDTKEEEARFTRAALEAAGVRVIHLDPSVRRTVGGAEISPEDVAAAAGMTIEQVRALGHEGKCQDAMIRGSIAAAHAWDARDPISGVLAVGGSMGSALAGALMQSFPYGLPKMIVSTMASGFTKPYMGVKDIAMMNAVTDISGINTISRDVFRNAAFAVAGMARGYDRAAPAEKPLVLITTLGTTEASVKRIRQALETDGCEVMVFHSSGAGGPTLDGLAESKDVALVLDLSQTEILDHIFGGLADTGPDRGKAALRKGIPTILAPGNADFIIGGPIDVSRVQFPGRRYHEHNPQLTAVRTTLDDLKKLADHLAANVAEAQGPVQVFTPLHGFSSHDSPAGHLMDPSVPPPFAEYLRQVMPGHVPVTAVDAHFNDEAFSDAVIAAARQMLKDL